MDILVSLFVRIVLPLLIVLVLCIWSYSAGVSRESDRRDAHDLVLQQKAEKDFEAAAEAATFHAVQAMEWKRKADRYYRKWQEKLNNVEDTGLSECSPAAAGCLLSPDWVRLYNDAWQPDGAPANTAGADAIPGGTGAATPREALVNHRINAQLCLNDRKRQRELIDLLHKLEANGAQPAD